MVPNVQLPRILNPAWIVGAETMHEVVRLQPVSLSLDLKALPLSTAALTMPPQEISGIDIKIHDFIELFTQNGSAGVFRVGSIANDVTQNVQISLNHALDTLNDSVWVPANIGKEDDIKETLWQYLEDVLSHQTRGLMWNGEWRPFWQLASHPNDTDPVRTKRVYKKLRLDNLLELVSDVAKEYESHILTYDFSTFPWTLDFVPRSDDVETEFRLSRNISSLKISLDDTDQCTRLYLSVTGVKENGDAKKNVVRFYRYDSSKIVYTLGGVTYRAQDVFGVICRTAGATSPQTVDSAAWVADADAFAADYLERHSLPSIQTEVDGVELFQATGVSLDETKLGGICRVTLPGLPYYMNTVYGLPVQQRIMSVRYPDALGEPQHVQLSLSNRREKAEDSIASANKKAKRAQAQARTLSSDSVSYDALIAALDLSADAQTGDISAADIVNNLQSLL